MTAFASPQELRTYLDGSTLDEDADAEWIAQATLLISLVSADIQSAARNRLIEGTVTAKLAGVWSEYLELPRRPILSVDAVSVNGQAISAGGYSWNERSLIRGGARIANYDASGTRWGGPAATVEVTYDYGYEAAEVPELVKSLTLRAAARSMQNPTGVAQESLGPWSVSFGSSSQRMAENGSHLTEAEVKMLRRKFSRTAGSQFAGSL